MYTKHSGTSCKAVFLEQISEKPLAHVGTVKFLAHFLTGGRPAVRYGYSCSSDASR